MHLPLESLSNKVVCGMHFVDSDYMHAPTRYTTSRLTCNAVPSVFSHQNAPKVTAQRKKPAERVYMSPTRKKHKASDPEQQKLDSAHSVSSQTPTVGRKPIPLICASTYRSKLRRLQQRLQRSQSALRLETLKRKEAEANLQCFSSSSPSLCSYKHVKASFRRRQL